MFSVYCTTSSYPRVLLLISISIALSVLRNDGLVMFIYLAHIHTYTLMTQKTSGRVTDAVHCLYKFYCIFSLNLQSQLTSSVC